MSRTTIEAGTSLATLINSFTVRPERQRELVRLLEEATEQVMRHQPGFVAANIHRSLDGTRVINYAQWESAQDMAAMRQDPRCQEHMNAALELATADPVLCTVESVHHR